MGARHNFVVGVLASGSGTTFEAVVRDRVETNTPIDFPLVVCSRPPEKAGIYERVARLNREFGLDIEIRYVGPQDYPQGKRGRGLTDQESEAICTAMDESGVGLIACLGFMRITRGVLQEVYGFNPGLHTSRYEGRMINTHPGILPETANKVGIKASELVIARGLPETAHTMHLVAPDVDAGPVISEVIVPVHTNDPAELFREVQLVEKRMVLGVLHKFLINQQTYQQDQAA